MDTTHQSPFAVIPSQETITSTIAALGQNNMSAELATSAEDAKRLAMARVPKGAEVFTMTSVTLHELGIDAELNSEEVYNPVRARLMAMDRTTQDVAMRKLGAAPEYVLGSVHAVTEQGQLLIASNTGSQLPAEAYGSAHVIFVVGVQKIVKNFEEGMRRIYEYTLPLESERAAKAYGVPGSFVSKLLVINREVQKDRIHVIFVPQNIGF